MKKADHAEEEREAVDTGGILIRVRASAITLSAQPTRRGLQTTEVTAPRLMESSALLDGIWERASPRLSRDGDYEYRPASVCSTSRRRAPIRSSSCALQPSRSELLVIRVKSTESKNGNLLRRKRRVRGAGVERL